MFTKSNFKKISFLIGALSIIIFMFQFFGVQWRGEALVTIAPNIELTALAPVKSLLVSLIGNDYGQLINNILCINIIWYVFVGFPVWLWYWVKEAGHLD